MWRQDLPDGEPPLPSGRFGRLRSRLPARGLPHLLFFDVHLPNNPFRRLPDESVTVADAHFELDHEARASNARTVRERGSAYRRRDQ